MKVGPFVITWHDSVKEYEQFKKNIKKFNNYRYHSEDRENLKPIVEETIKRNFANYINGISERDKWRVDMYNTKWILANKDKLLKQFRVKLVNLIMDKSFNKTNVYYIDLFNDYITV